MSHVLIGALGLLLMTLNVVAGLRFRMGKTPVGSRRGTEAMIRWHRNPDLPVIWRMVPLVIPIPASAAVPLFVLLSLGSLVDPATSRLPPSMLAILWLGSIGLVCLGVGAGSAVAYRRPHWLVPQWLIDDDRRAGHVARAPDAFDRLTLIVVGGLGVLLGLLSIGCGVLLSLR